MEKSCKTPAERRGLLCHFALSLGMISQTVTYSNVPPAKPCRIGTTISVQSFFILNVNIPIPIPTADPAENTNIASISLKKVLLAPANSNPKQNPITNL